MNLNFEGVTAWPPAGAIFAMAAPSEAAIQALRDQLQALTEENETIVAKADEEDRDLSDEDVESIEANKVKIEKVERQIAAREAVVKPVAGSNRKTTAEAGDGKPRVPAAPRDSQRFGFRSMGDFAKAVRAHRAGEYEAEDVRKLMAAATTYGNEGTGADGGHLVPPEFSQMIWQKVEAEENLMSRCTELTPSGNSMTLPKDETTPWGTTGLQVYWESEGAAATASKGVFESSTLRLHKLMALAPVTEEMLEDSTGFESWIQAKVPGILAHKINSAIISGTGAGQPLGILNSPSAISVAKETSQAADTVWFDNINKMYARMYAPWRRNAVWLINQDVEPQLEAMAFQPSGAASHLPTAASTPVYLPPGGLSEAPYARLKGRPVIPLQACDTVGDKGDIIFVDLKQYWVLRKAAGIRSDTSMHLYFDQAITAFRFIFRINGQPAWSSAITAQNSNNSLSWAVTLDERS